MNQHESLVKGGIGKGRGCFRIKRVAILRMSLLIGVMGLGIFQLLVNSSGKEM